MGDEEWDFLGYKYSKAHYVRKTSPHTHIYIAKADLERRLVWLKIAGQQHDKTEQALNNWPKERKPRPR